MMHDMVGHDVGHAHAGDGVMDVLVLVLHRLRYGVCSMAGC